MDMVRQAVASKKFSFKKLAGVMHLWMGLASGLVIIIIALTGAIYAWQPELSEAFYAHLHVKAEEKPFVALSVLKEKAEAELPGKTVSRISFAGRDHSVGVSFNNKKAGYSYIVYMNPYSGEVIKVKDMDRDFFRQVLNGHMHLWLPDPIGKTIVAYTTLIFGLIIVSGIVMWWPRKWSKATRKQSLSVKWNASPKRLNYDLHNVLGFYASWVMLFVVLTGLVWAFESVRNTEYWMFSAGKSFPAADKAKSTKPAVAVAGNPLDKVAAQMDVRYPNPARMQYLLPANDKAVITVRMFPEEKRSFNGDYFAFNQYTGAELPGAARGKFEEANGGEKANRMTFDIHTGMIGGLPLRLLVFFAALVTASLPVTGFYIWWGKKKKQARPATRKTPAMPQLPEVELA